MISNLDELRYEGGYPTAESIRKHLDCPHVPQSQPY
jgi:hypothetical protein